MKTSLSSVVLMLLLNLFSLRASAADVPQSFTLDGQLFGDAAATAPLLDPSIAMKIQILDEDKVCVLYEETQTLSTLASKGYFTIQVGTETSSLKRTAGDSGNAMATVFQNTNAVTGRLVSNGAACATALPASAKRRFVRIQITPSTMGSTARVLAPDLTVDSMPNAIVAERAESLQGLRAAEVLKVNTASGSALSQSNLESLFTSTTRFNSLTSVIDGTSINYMRSNSTSGAQLPVLPGAPSTPTTGAVWFDSSDSKIKVQTSGGPVTLGTGSGSVTSVGFTAPSELTVSGAPVTAAGTIAVTWANQTTNKVLAAPDGSTGAPSFRALTANDIPNLAWTKITSLVPTTILGYGITDAVTNAGGTPSLQSGLDAAKGTAATAGRIWISTDTKEIYRDNGATWDKLASAAGAAGGDLSGTYPNPTVAKLQGQSVSATTPIAGQVLKFSTTTWTPSNFSVGDLKTSAGAQQFAGSSTCSASQTLTWSSLTDTFTCTNITGLAATSITTGTVDAARLPASATAWTVNGADVYRTAGNVGIGTALPSAVLTVIGTAVANGNAPEVLNIQGGVGGSNGASGGSGGPISLSTGAGGAGYDFGSPGGLLSLVAGDGGSSQVGGGAGGSIVLNAGNGGEVGGVISGVGGDITLNPGGGGGPNGRVLLAPGGSNVGIGTTTPQFSLDVAGGVRVSGTLVTNMLVEKSTTLNPTAVGWYRIISQSDSNPIQGGVIRIIGAYDNRMTDVEIQYNIGGWGVGGSIQQTRYSNYNAGLIDAVRVSADAGATYLDIHVASATAPDVITVYGYGPLMRPMVAVPVVGAVAGATDVSVLSLGFGFRSTAGAVFAENGGSVGIGTASPTEKLSVDGNVKVAGQVYASSFSGSSNSVNWNNGNTGTTSYDCASPIDFSNLIDGGTYTLAVTGAGTTQCDFSNSIAITGGSSQTVSYRFRPANAVRYGASHTLYTFSRIGTVVYVSWVSGF